MLIAPWLAKVLLPALIAAWWEAWFDVWEDIAAAMLPTRIENDDNFDYDEPNAEISGWGGE